MWREWSEFTCDIVRVQHTKVTQGSPPPKEIRQERDVWGKREEKQKETDSKNSRVLQEVAVSSCFGAQLLSTLDLGR